MTLIDPRRGMVKVFEVLSQETGLALDGEAFVSRLGPPLAHEFARYGLSDQTVQYLVGRFREHYQELVVPLTVPMPGAVAAVRAVLDRGGRVLVVTAKRGLDARAHLDALGLSEVPVVGELWSSAKAVALREHGAEIYVGDHLGDITGARAADALAVSVATGPISAADLEAAGADVVLSDLREFPEWLGAYLLATVH